MADSSSLYVVLVAAQGRPECDFRKTTGARFRHSEGLAPQVSAPGTAFIRTRSIVQSADMEEEQSLRRRQAKAASTVLPNANPITRTAHHDCPDNIQESNLAHVHEYISE